MRNQSDCPSDSELGDVLTVDAPCVPVAIAEQLLSDLYGIVGTAHVLPSERDHNFHIRTDGRGEFVLKISHPAEPREITDFQTAALLHIASVDPDLPVPVVVPTAEGAFMPRIDVSGGPPRTVRLLTYLGGRLLHETLQTARQDRNLGIFLARLGKALQGFFHPNAASDLLWDLRQIGKTRSLLVGMADPEQRRLVERFIDDCEAHALPLLSSLRGQVIHNDMNPYNVVVYDGTPESVAGILDFGDILHGPLICDVAVGASYRWTTGEHPLAGMGRFINGYHSARRLEDVEIDSLFDLIGGRLAVTASIARWQANRFPEKRDYVLRLNTEIWSAIRQLASLSRDEGRQFLHQAVRQG